MRKWRSSVGTVLLASLMLSGGLFAAGGTTPAGAAGKATKSPIVLGTLAGLTGSAAQPWVAKAIQAYFNNVNKQGGINGHPVSLKVVTGGTTPTAAASGAQQLINQDGVVGLVSDSIFLDCPINGQTYTTSGVAVTEFPYTTTCYNYPAVFPYVGTSGQAEEGVGKWAAAQGAKKVAYLGVTLPGVGQDGADMGTYLAKNTKARLVLSKLYTATATAAELDGFVASAKQLGVDTVDVVTTPPLGQLALQQAIQEGFGPANGIRWILTSSFYNQPLLKTFGSSANGVYVQCTSYCWQQTSKSVKQAYAVLKAGNVTPIDGLTGTAYDGAAVMTAALKTIKGAVTRASVMKAMSSLRNFQLPLAPIKVSYTGTPSKASPRQLVGGGQVVKWDNGKFSVASKFIAIAP